MRYERRMQTDTGIAYAGTDAGTDEGMHTDASVNVDHDSRSALVGRTGYVVGSVDRPLGTTAE